jgi:hypothetical protein
MRAVQSIKIFSYKHQFVDKAARLVERAIEYRMLDLHLERLADIAGGEPEQGHSRPVAISSRSKAISKCAIAASALPRASLLYCAMSSEHSVRRLRRDQRTVGLRQDNPAQCHAGLVALLEGALADDTQP